MFDVGQLTSENMAKYNASQTPTARSQHTVVFHDYMTRFVLPLCASMSDCQARSPCVVSSVYLVNAASFGLRQAWSLKGYAQEVSQLLAICYPEMVDRCYVSTLKDCTWDMLINAIGHECASLFWKDLGYLVQVC